MPRTVSLVLSALVAASAAPTAARVTVDDLMKLRTIVDVEISPDGSRVAYAVSTPSLERNAHEVALFVVPATGGTPTPLARGSVLTSSPNLRWSPAGRTISFLATAAGRTQAYEVDPATPTEAPKPMTNAAAVIAYEWAPDGKSIAYVSPEALSAEETRQQQDPSFVIHADAPERPMRLWVKALDGSAPRVVSPAMHFVDSLSWAPDSKEIVVLGVDEARVHGPVLHANLRRVSGRRHAASRRRSPRHEHEAAGLARRLTSRVHLHWRQARDHGVPQPERRAASLRRAGHAPHVRPRRRVGERVRVVRRQQVDLSCKRTTAPSAAASTCSSRRSSG